MSTSVQKVSLSVPLLSDGEDIDTNTLNASISSHTKRRKWMYENIVSTKWYQVYILITILINLCIIAIDSMVSTSYHITNIILLSLFTFEIILKILSFGVIDRITANQIPFFRHPYHIFDFLVIVVSWITLLKFDITCTALRIAFIIFFIPILEMAMIVISIIKSLKSIVNVLFFFLLFYIIFGVFGIYFMSGILHKRCYPPHINYENYATINISNVLCSTDNDCIMQSNANNNTYTNCLALSENPHNGIFSFDNIFFSSLQIFISSTGHWAILMSYIDSCYTHSAITIYWLILTFIYFFILLPLLLAFISDSFNDINLAKNALYLRIKKNTIFSCATANVIFYKFSTSDEDKLYYAQLKSTSPTINPLLNVPKSNRRKHKHTDSGIELQEITPSLSGVDERDTVQNMQHDLDELDLEERMDSNSKRRMSDFSDVSGIIAIGSSDFNIRDESLVAMILRKSKNTLRSKHELENTSKCRHGLYTIVNSNVFQTIVMILVVANVICLSLKNPKFSDHSNKMLDWVNDVFLFIYVSELLLRILSVGLVKYWRKTSVFNIFDGILIIFSFVMYLVSILHTNDEYIHGLSGMISFRLLRIIPFIYVIKPFHKQKLYKYFEHFNRIIVIVTDAFSQMVWLFLILILFLFVCGYFGTSLYNNNDRNISNVIIYDETHSFNNICFSVLTTFQIATGQNWVDILANTILLFNNSMWSLLYFLIIVIFGLFIFPNYFIALCIGSIDKHQNEDSEILQSVLPKARHFRQNQDISDGDLKVLIAREINMKRREIMEQRIYNYLFTHRDKTIMFGRSLKCFLPNNGYRKRVNKIVTNKWYVWFIDFCIIINAILFGIYNMNDLANDTKTGDMDEYYLLYSVDIIFVIIFSIEITLNIITFGISSSSSSLTRNWSKLMDPMHKSNWRIRCLQIWKLMCRYDAYYNVNANIYSNDLGIYEIIKSHNGLVIVWCVVPSSGLEIRILFKEDKWRTIYCCKQYYQSQIITQKMKKDVDDIFQNREDSVTASVSVLSEMEQKYDDSNDTESIAMSSSSVPITRAGYGYNIGKKKYKFNNKKNLFKKGLNNDDVRKWEKWTLKKRILSEFDHESKAKFMIDQSVEQLLLSVSLNYKNTNSFVSDYWNILDFIVVFFSLISLFFNLRFWSTLRALRLFRVIIRQDKMRQIFTAIRKCLPSMISLLIFIFLLYYILSIIGLNLFYATFDKCSCNDILASTINTKAECQSYGGVEWNMIDGECACYDSMLLNKQQCDNENNPALAWSAPYFRFDDISSALFSVFLIARGAQWDYFLYESYSIHGVGESTQNIHIHDTETIISGGTYFLAVVFIGQYCLLSLFMAIIISNYIRYYNEESKLLLNYKQQKSLQRISIFIKMFNTKYCKISPFINHDDTTDELIFFIRNLCHRIVDSSSFHYVVYSVIILNILICCTLHYTFEYDSYSPSFSSGGLTDRHFELLIDNSTIIFTIFYTIEIILKLTAYGFRFFWSYKSYRYCCIITFLSWIAILVYFVSENKKPILPITTLMLFRAVLIVPYLESFWQMLKWSHVPLFYLTIVAFILLYICGIFGKYIFGDIDENGPAAPSKFGDYIALLQYPSNLFKDMQNALYFLYIYMFNSGDAWTPAVIKLFQTFERDWIVILYFVVVYVVILVFYSIFFAIIIDIYNDWKKVQYISNHLRMLHLLQYKWKLQVKQLREICINDQETMKNEIECNQYKNYRSAASWKQYVCGTTLFDTYISAIKFLHILSMLPPPIGFKHVANTYNALFIPSNLLEKENRRLPSDIYKKLMFFLTDLKIPIRKNPVSAKSMRATMTSNANRRYTGFFDEWDFIVNFSDIIHAFTWKLLHVDVLVNVEDDEQFILDWFTTNWDSVDMSPYEIAHTV